MVLLPLDTLFSIHFNHLKDRILLRFLQPPLGAPVHLLIQDPVVELSLLECHLILSVLGIQELDQSDQELLRVRHDVLDAPRANVVHHLRPVLAEDPKGIKEAVVLVFGPTAFPQLGLGSTWLVEIG